MVYFDNAATTFPKPEKVYNFMDDFYRNYGANAGRGSYKKANKAFQLIENTREKLSLIFDIDNKEKKEIIFTSSATMSINLILQGYDWKRGDVLYYSPFEHNAVLRNIYQLKEKYDIELKKIPVNTETLEFEIDSLQNMFNTDPPTFITTTHTSNVCGSISPIQKIANLSNKYDADILVDAAQSAGIVNLNLKNIDYFIWSGHKSLYGPFGVAGFVIDNDAPIPEPLLYGGTGSESASKRMPDTLPLKFEAGSKNIMAIAGLNAALKWIEEVGSKEIYNHDKKIINKLLEGLNEFLDVELFVPNNLDEHFNVISAKFKNYNSIDFAKILDNKFDIAVRSGLHCSPKAHELLGTSPNGLVRFSVSYFNTEEEIDYLLDSLESIII